MKEKIAISIDSSLLSLIDSLSNSPRSQTIESLLKQAMKKQPISTAILLIHKNDQKHLLKQIDSFPLIQHHFNFLTKNKIKQLYIITEPTSTIQTIIKELPKNIKTEIISEKTQQGTASALSLLKTKIKHSFILINGDTFNDFSIQNMINEHLNSNKLITMGLISSQTPHKRGAVTLDGNSVIDFKEKQETPSNIINAGIYIIKPEIFSLLKNKKSLEKEIFPELAKQKQIQGFFTFGNFVHAPEF
ncbi:hypothetical protein CL618_01725 [archaeon]|nr:hypothetical protein [archaeon]